MNLVPKRTFKLQSPILDQNLQVDLFIFSLFYRFWCEIKFDSAAPDLTHGGKLGANLFLFFMFLSLFLAEGQGGISDSHYSHERFHLL
jgi:hypothetical protein